MYADLHNSMICLGIITTPDDPHTSPENRRALRDRLRGDFTEDFDMPDPAKSPAAATSPVNVA